MRHSNFKKVLYVRRAFQMTAISVILILVISIVIVMTTGSTINDECEPVQNLALNEEDMQLILTWEPGVGCQEGVFKVEGTVNGEDLGLDDIFQGTTLTIDKESCSKYNIVIMSRNTAATPVSPTEITYFSGIAGSGEVRDLVINNYRLEWNEPENADNCELQYRVDIIPNGFPSTSYNNIVDKSFSLALIPCSENNILVTAIVVGSTKSRESVSIVQAGPRTRSAPNHISTDPNENGALVTWLEVIEIEDNTCKIAAIEFEILEDETEEEPRISIAEVNGEYTLDALKTNTVFKYSARWILEGEGYGSRSDDVVFKTVPLTPPTSIDSIAMDDSFMVHWQQEYDHRFIKGHDLLIENLGPDHFLPEHCPRYENQIHTTTIAGAATEYKFETAMPNFRYKITVTTHFQGLGISVPATDVITIPIRNPGSIQDITTRHEYENGVPYEVKSHIDWKIPCDVNGPVKHFNIKISGELQADAIQEKCTTDFLEHIVQGVELEDFTFNTNILLPFFDYIVYITTVLDTPDTTIVVSSTTEWNLSPLPTPYTPH